LRLKLVVSVWVVLGSALPSSALDCLSPSYTVRQGKNPLDDIDPRDLAPGEHQSLQQLFQWMGGDWVGTGQVVTCAGPEDAIREEITTYRVAARGANAARGQFTFEAHTYDADARTGSDQRFDFFLSERRLATADLSGSDIELLIATAGELAFVKKSRIKGAGIFTAHEWLVRLQKVGESNLEVENVFFVNGRFTSASRWRLLRNR
jgi:hypothetical protein